MGNFGYFFFFLSSIKNKGGLVLAIYLGDKLIGTKTDTTPFNNHINNSAIHVTEAEKENWNKINALSASNVLTENNKSIEEELQNLNMIYQHCWRVSPLEWQINQVVSDEFYSFFGTTSFYFCYGSTSSLNTLYYSSEIEMDDEGNVALVNPTSVNYSYAAGSTARSAISGKYVQGFFLSTNTSSPSEVIFLLGDTTDSSCYSQGGSSGKYYEQIKNSFIQYAITTKKSPDEGNSTYVFSDNETTYPIADEDNENFYQYLGKPFDSIKTCPKWAIGSYVGTYSSSANYKQITLSFDFTPYWIQINEKENFIIGSEWTTFRNWDSYASSMSANSGTRNVIWDNNSVTLSRRSGGTTAGYPPCILGTKYTYICFGW